jgi:small subunit ribosomal protein S8e
MPLWHHDHDKRKITGGKRRSFRTKRAFEAGGFATETGLDVPVRVRKRTLGGTFKMKLFSGKYANVTDPSRNDTTRAEILRVISNPVNADYDRRKIMTKGATIETPLGNAIITSRPGQDGIINAILIK